MNKKIFVIGFNKTGTVSIHNVFKSVGINSYHGTKQVLKIIESYDAFTDGEHFNFKDYYDLYPNSLFILNTRPLKKWLVSRYKHARTRKFKNCWCWPVTDTTTYAWIKERESHFLNVLSFFKNKKDSLLIINIEKTGWEESLLNFIGKPGKLITFHSNKRPDIKFDQEKLYEINTNVDRCLKENNYTGTEILPLDVNINLYNYTI